MRSRTILGLQRTHAAVAALALALLCLACAAGSAGGAQSVARQAWRKARGPVVPHDTFPRDCSLCHVGSSWNEIRDDFAFDHAAETGVPLAGAHQAAECLRCHNDRGPVAVFAARGCGGCHEDVHLGRLGNACTVCHDEAAGDWRPGGPVAEHAKTRFPLVGAHASTACWACHPGAQVGNFVQASTRCVDCHAADLAGANEPDHARQGWTDNCERCHLPTSWSQAGFEHGFFPLQGGHRGLACSACHVGRDFGGLDPTCYACHQDDYRGARDHVTQNFPTDCTLCHTIARWEGARFDHRGIVSGCAACHLDDYQAARRPDHAGNGFPTSCEQCHTTKTWGDGQFSHPQFPITSGAHRNLTCQQCHPVPGAFRQFSCTDCHEHRQRETDDDHDRVPGYVYKSSACYACHPDGND
ncbi:MAG: hypothetical protein JNK02_06555 [Planctomycetes bacterium]|nr:hypothetical protein [Planctomycetota bacterium]